MNTNEEPHANIQPGPVTSWCLILLADRQGHCLNRAQVDPVPTCFPWCLLAWRMTKRLACWNLCRRRFRIWNWIWISMPWDCSKMRADQVGLMPMHHDRYTKRYDNCHCIVSSGGRSWRHACDKFYKQCSINEARFKSFEDSFSQKVPW